MGHVCVEVEIVRDLFVAFFNQFHINHNNLVVAGGFDGGTPRLDAAGDKEVCVIDFAVAPIERIHASDDVIEGKELPVVRMSHDLNIHIGAAGFEHILRSVVEHNQGEIFWNAAHQIIQRLAMGIVLVESARAIKGVRHVDKFIFKDADA